MVIDQLAPIYMSLYPSAFDNEHNKFAQMPDVSPIYPLLIAASLDTFYLVAPQR